MFPSHDKGSNSITSRWYKVIADDDCERQYMYKIRWSNECNNIGDLVYYLTTQGYSWIKAPGLPAWDGHRLIRGGEVSLPFS